MHLARETLTRADDARSFIRGLMKTTINLRPDLHNGELRIELHGQANPAHDIVVAAICTELNTTETHYPGTKLRLNYVPLRSSSFPTGQDVWVYCALIAALLLSRRSGKLPTKRMMERLRFWMMGWATDDELAETLGSAKKRN